MKLIHLLIIFSLISMDVVYASQKTLTCVLQGLTDKISFKVPGKIGDLPKIDFSYPVKTIIFSLGPKNLLLVAVDSDETSRPRLFISAQYHKNQHSYEGQFMTDYGGNQMQLDNGYVSCTERD